VLFRSLSVLDSVRVGDVVAVASPPLPPDACSPPRNSASAAESGWPPALAIRRVAAVAGDELVASDDSEIMVVPHGCVWITCDNASGVLSSRADSRLIGPVSLYDVHGRALAIVSPGIRAAPLSSNRISVAEDKEWSRLEQQFLRRYPRMTFPQHCELNCGRQQ
jgi:hypothetical protein